MSSSVSEPADVQKQGPSLRRSRRCCRKRSRSWQVVGPIEEEVKVKQLNRRTELTPFRPVHKTKPKNRRNHRWKLQSGTTSYKLSKQLSPAAVLPCHYADSACMQLATLLGRPSIFSASPMWFLGPQQRNATSAGEAKSTRKSAARSLGGFSMLACRLCLGPGHTKHHGGITVARQPVNRQTCRSVFSGRTSAIHSGFGPKAWSKVSSKLFQWSAPQIRRVTAMDTCIIREATAQRTS